MQYWNGELDEFLTAHPETPKVSLYLPEGIDLSGTRVFTGLREMAMKLLEKSGDKELLEDFRHWSLHVWSYLLDTQRAPTTAVFFSRSIRKMLHLDAELPSRVVVSDSFHIKPLVYLRSRVTNGTLLQFTDIGVEVSHSDGRGVNLHERISAPLRNKDWTSKMGRKELIDFLDGIARRIPKENFIQVWGAPEGLPRSKRFWSDYFNDYHLDHGVTNVYGEIDVKARFLARLKLWKLSKQNDELSALFQSPEALEGPDEILFGIRERKLKKVYVSLDAVRWGVLNHETGQVTYHPLQKDHRDEDVLDDLTELALREGIEVQVLRQTSLPRKLEIIGL